jgi:hypothetical protein
MTMLRLSLAAATFLAGAALPALAGEVVVTGENGGTLVATRDCARADGTATCTLSRVLTAPDGRTASKVRTRVTTQGQSVAEITRTGPEGNSRTRTRTTTWGG